MISEQQAKKLMAKLVDLRKKVQENNSPENIRAFKQHEELCIKEFQYVILIRANRYKNFNNYEDIIQEGNDALLMAMKSYNPKKGSFWAWTYKYVNLRIARAANTHTVIKYPMQFAKDNVPKREPFIPKMIDNDTRPDDAAEKHEIIMALHQCIDDLGSPISKQILTMLFGLDGQNAMRVDAISKKLDISLIECQKIIRSSLAKIKNNLY